MDVEESECIISRIKTVTVDWNLSKNSENFGLYFKNTSVRDVSLKCFFVWGQLMNVLKWNNAQISATGKA